MPKPVTVPALDHAKHIDKVIEEILKYDSIHKQIHAAKIIITEWIGDKRDLQVLIDRGYLSAKEGDTEYSLPEAVKGIDTCIDKLEQLIIYVRSKRKQ